MPEERLPKKILYGELEMGKRSHSGQKNDTKKPSKPPSRTSTYQQMHRAEQSGEASSEEVLVNVRQQRISEPEQKGAQRKARAKASLTELSCFDHCCSICNRQFGARIGQISHLRTHKQ